jgi:DNA-binding response OmpR family regulator
VRVMIGRIRAQFAQARPDLPPPLETVHRVGYRLTG